MTSYTWNRVFLVWASNSKSKLCLKYLCGGEVFQPRGKKKTIFQQFLRYYFLCVWTNERVFMAQTVHQGNVRINEQNLRLWWTMIKVCLVEAPDCPYQADLIPSSPAGMNDRVLLINIIRVATWVICLQM